MKKLDWNEAYKEGRKFTPVSEIVLDKLNLRGGRALDIGCGEGELMKQLKARGYNTTGIDLSNYSADIVGDFMEYDFKDKKFDLITANLVIAFIENKKAFIKKVLSLLNNSGQFVIVTPVLYDKYKKHYSEHDITIGVNYEELKLILPKKFEIIYTSYGFGYSSALTIVCKKS